MVVRSALPNEQTLRERLRYGKGPQTPDKHEGYSAVAWLRAAVLHQVFVGNPWMDMVDHGFDLTAGPAHDLDTGDGSPLIFLKAALAHGITTRAWFVEGDAARHAKLREVLASRGFMEPGCGVQAHTVCDFWQRVLPGLIESAKRGLRRPDFMQGLVYYDPTAWAMDEFDALAMVQELAPRVDLAMNISATTAKRCFNADHCPDARDLLDIVRRTGKPYWRLRAVPGFQQWTILLGTSWKEFPDWRSKGFVRLESPEGQATFAKLYYTNEQLRQLDQLPLFTV